MSVNQDSKYMVIVQDIPMDIEDPQVGLVHEMLLQYHKQGAHGIVLASPEAAIHMVSSLYRNHTASEVLSHLDLYVACIENTVLVFSRGDLLSPEFTEVMLSDPKDFDTITRYVDEVDEFMCNHAFINPGFASTSSVN